MHLIATISAKIKALSNIRKNKLAIELFHRAAYDGVVDNWLKDKSALVNTIAIHLISPLQQDTMFLYQRQNPSMNTGKINLMFSSYVF